MTTSQQINAMEAAVKKRLRDRRTNFSESLWREWCLNEFVPWVGRESAGE